MKKGQQHKGSMVAGGGEEEGEGEEGRSGGGGGVSRRVRIHIDNWAAMTGVSHFGEMTEASMVALGMRLSYDKTESLEESAFTMVSESEGQKTRVAVYHYLLHDKEKVEGYEMIESVRGFDRVDPKGFILSGGSKPLFIMSEQVFILKSKSE